MMGETLLAVEQLVLGYGRIAAVKGIDLEVGNAKVVSLIGSNGAGKTTTLRGLSGLICPWSGSIRFLGQEIAALQAHAIARLGIVHVPEGRQIFAAMSVSENLRMGAFLVTSAAEARRRRDAVFAKFPRLAERRFQPAGLLSGGEQQMLAIGRALMADPRLLLLDEPSMGLAPLLVEEIFSIIADLKRDGRTILLVEQNAQAALEISDFSYVLEGGKIKLHGEAAAIAQDPQVVESYLGGAIGD
jgi:branched-chain amino acid transport system ATP-binding protein